jgi:flavin-dependent dehydrogenase
MGKTFDLIVVGASFAGLACARSAARQGLKVLCIERRTDIGAKLHTTGLLVNEVLDEIDWFRTLPSRLIRRIEQVRLYAPNLKHMSLQSPGYGFVATDTPGLMHWMADGARSEGVQVQLGSSFKQVEYENGRWQLPDIGSARYLVGADGAQSRVAKVLSLGENTEFLFGVEYEFPLDCDQLPLALHCFLDETFAPGYIGWAIPGVKSLQVGIAARMPHRPRLHAFLKHIAPVLKLHAAQACGMRAGHIPIGGIVGPVSKPGALLVGDAAGMVSPLTAGGIHTALQHGAWAGDAIAAHLLQAAPDPGTQAAGQYPAFYWKRKLRWLADRLPLNRLGNMLIGTPPLRATAQLIYFHQRGLLSRTGWLALKA